MSNNPLQSASTPKISRKFVYNADGTDVGQSRNTSSSNVKNPIAISTPMAISERFGMFDMREDILSVVKDQLKMILLTNKGERVGNYDFGANVRAILFSQIENDIEDILIENIQKNVEKYMPFTRLISFNLYTGNEIEDLQENEMLIEITFSVESLNLQSSVEVIF
jgi:phage baseplate assembly protein W